MIRIATVALLLATALPAAAQVATSTAGDVGSASLRGGYPAGGGAVTLPTLTPSATTPAGTTATGSGTTTSSTSATGGGSAGASSSATTGGRGGAAAASGTSAITSGSSENWVLCPPSGSSGIAPFLTGTDLSCAPK